MGMVLGLLVASPLGAANNPAYWVFVGTYTGATSKGIYVARMDGDGNLTPPELAAESQNPAFLALDPRSRFLYAANEINSFRDARAGAVSAFAVARGTGRLTPLNQVSSVTPGPCHVSVDATGSAVLVANYGGGSVQSYPVESDGRLGEPASFIQLRGSSVNRDRQNEPHTHMIAMDPANRFALVCDLGLDQVLAFRLDARTATLTPNDPPWAASNPGAGPRHLAFRPDGKFVYVINELDCTVTVYAYDALRGALTMVETVSTLPAGEEMRPELSTAEIVVHPSGRFLYGSNRGHDSLVVYAIDPQSGRLTVVEHVPSGGRTPRNFNVDPAGRFLLVANQRSNSVVVYRIDESSGRLAPTGATMTVENPVCVVFAPVE